MYVCKPLHVPPYALSQQLYDVCLSVTTVGNFWRRFSLRPLKLDRGQIEQSGCTPTYSHAHAFCQSALCLFLPPDGRRIGGRDLACHKRKQITLFLTPCLMLNFAHNSMKQSAFKDKYRQEIPCLLWNMKLHCHVPNIPCPELDASTAYFHILFS